MAKKKLLSEKQVRRFMGLAGIKPLNEMAHGYKRDEEEMEEMQNQLADNGEAHPPMKNPADMVQHMRDMIENDKLTNEQILELHPEIANFFTNTGAANGQTETSPQGQENGTT